MTRPASRAELDAMSEQDRAAYCGGAAFSVGEDGRLVRLTGRPGGGVYAIQRPAYALREALHIMKDRTE